jgi:hypothetical protein
MSSAPSVPGVEVGASWLGGCEHVLTAGALKLLAVLHGTFGQRRAGTVSDIIAARIRPAAVEMMDALALQAAEPPSGAAIRLAPSRSWSLARCARPASARPCAPASWPAPGRPL